MDPLDAANEIEVNSRPEVLIKLSVRLVVTLAIMVLIGIGVLTFNVFLMKQQLDNLAKDLVTIASVVSKNQDRLTLLERVGASDVNIRLQRMEKDIENCLRIQAEEHR